MSDAERKRLRWIPVTERLPEFGEEVLVLVDGHRGPAWSNNYKLVAYLSAYSSYWLQERHQTAGPIVGVTHWMPLPTPPEEDAQQPRGGEEVTTWAT